MNTFQKMRTTIIAALIIIALHASASAQGVKDHAFLIFAAGFGTLAGPPNNQLQLGSLHMLEGRGSIDYDLYDGNANLQQTNAPFKHEMTAPYRGKKDCQGRDLEIAHPLKHVHDAISWKQTADSLIVVTSEGVETWQPDPKVPFAYVLASMKNEKGTELPLAVGYAFLADTDTVTTQISRANLLDRYNGEIHHKDMKHSATDDWLSKGSSFDLREFTESYGGRILKHSKQGILQDRDNWAHHSILFDYSTRSNLIMYHDYGHDFNHNGCFDESGHAKTMFGVKRNDSDKLREIVYIEYSYNKRTGFPMMSVGRYYTSGSGKKE